MVSTFEENQKGPFFLTINATNTCKISQIPSEGEVRKFKKKKNSNIN